MAGAKAEVTEAPKSSRKKSHYSTSVEDDDLEFIRAIEDFKRMNDQPFPSWSEVLKVLRSLGYTKQAPHDA